MKNYWRTLGALERGIVVGIAVLFVALVAGAVAEARLTHEQPCSLHRPCVTWVWMNDMMQCVQRGDPEPRDPQACAERGGR